MSKLKEEILREINKAIVAFKIGKITELEKDIAIKAQLDLYAKEKLKEWLPEKGSYACYECGSDGFDKAIDKTLDNANNK